MAAEQESKSLAGGWHTAFATAFVNAYPALLNVAHCLLASDPVRGRISASDLVHIAFVRLSTSGRALRWHTGSHLQNIVKRSMRQALANEGRRAKRERALLRRVVGRSQTWRETIEDHVDLMAALRALRRERPVAAALLWHCLDRGATPGEASEQLGMTTRKARRLWHDGVTFLRRALRDRS